MVKTESKWQCEPCQSPQSPDNICLVCSSSGSRTKLKIVKRGPKQAISRLRSE